MPHTGGLIPLPTSPSGIKSQVSSDASNTFSALSDPDCRFVPGTADGASALADKRIFDNFSTFVLRNLANFIHLNYIHQKTINAATACLSSIDPHCGYALHPAIIDLGDQAAAEMPFRLLTSAVFQSIAGPGEGLKPAG
jgi:hypothetical protein